MNRYVCTYMHSTYKYASEKVNISRKSKCMYISRNPLPLGYFSEAIEKDLSLSKK